LEHIRKTRSTSMSNITSINAPELIEYECSKDPGWIIISWIEGENISNIRKREVDAIIEFTANTQCAEDNSFVHYARDANRSIVKTIEGINQRGKDLEQKLSNINDTSLSKKWIHENIINKAEYIYEKMKDGEENRSLTPATGIIMSVSDVGIHNMKRIEKQFYFYDFEYAGKDDSAKLFCDLILQPRHEMNECLFKYTLSRYTEKLIEKEPIKQWRERVRMISKILKQKWMIIICNSIIKEGSEIDEKAIYHLEEYKNREHHKLLQELD